MDNLIFHKPDFICIGPEKTGTTWLHKNLQQHPHIFLPYPKEVRYFWEKVFLCPETTDNFWLKFTSSHWHYRSIRRYALVSAYHNFNNLFHFKFNPLIHRCSWDWKYLFSRHSDTWYNSLFNEEKNIITGDISPLYYRLPEIEIERISQKFPHVKIIILLRNPIDRAWSKAKMNLCVHQKQTFTKVTAEDWYRAFDEEFSYLPSYQTLISNWQKYFSPEQVKVFFYETILDNNWNFLQEICNFIQVDINKFPPSLQQHISKKINAGLKIDIPPQYANYLASLYKNCIQEMCQQYQMYPQQWAKIGESYLSLTK